MTRPRGRLKDKQSRKPAAEAPVPKTAGHPWEVPPSLAAGVALIVAVLAAVGVSGELLTRSARNEPVAMATVVVGALLAAGIPTAVAASWARRWALSLAVLLVIGAAVAAVLVGTASLTAREQPSLSLAGTTTATATTVTVTATATGLRSDEDMLVQLQAVESLPGTPPWELQEECRTNRLARDGSSPGPLLLWEQAGPDATGATEVTSLVEVEPGAYEAVCAAVILRGGSVEDACTDRQAGPVVDGQCVVGSDGWFTGGLGRYDRWMTDLLTTDQGGRGVWGLLRTPVLPVPAESG